MKRICVFCGSSFGNKSEYLEKAIELGKAIASKNIELVYGGAKVGLMGKIASTVLEEDGEVIGIIPKDLFEKEVAMTDLKDLRVVNSMHERKSLMAKLSDGFIAMPGGFGTFEEIFEVITWGQLNFHKKPCGLLNICGYYDNLIKFLDNSVKEGFIKAEHRSMIIIENDVETLMRKMEVYEHPEIEKAKFALESLNNEPQ